MFFAYNKLLGRNETRHDVLSVDMNSLIHLPRRSSKNCDLQFANTDRQTYILKENYSIDGYARSRLCSVLTATNRFRRLPIYTVYRCRIMSFFNQSVKPSHRRKYVHIILQSVKPSHIWTSSGFCSRHLTYMFASCYVGLFALSASIGFILNYVCPCSLTIIYP